MKNYNRMTNNILNKMGVRVDIEFLKHGDHLGDGVIGDVYKATIIRGNRSFSLEFEQSIAKSKRFQDKLNKRVYAQSGKGLGNNFTYLYPERFPKNKVDEKYGDFKIIQGEAPDNYDIFACLTKYDPGTFDNFCSEFGYDTDSKKAEKTYNAVLSEFKNMQSLFSDKELNILSYINWTE